MKILLVEDDATFQGILRKVLEREGYIVDTAGDGETALYKIKIGHPALVILDLRLPRKNGFEVCREARKLGKDLPILMITAVSEEFGASQGLDLGADDYLRKPFEMAEFVSRVRSLLRRESQQKSTFLDYGKLVVDPRSHRVFFANKELHLNPKEYALLVYLIYHQGKAVSTAELVENVWGEELAEMNSNSLEVYVHRLRKLLTECGMAERLTTVRGFGYQLLALNSSHAKK